MTLSIYPIIAPLILTPLSYVLWHGDPIGWLVPILWAYIVPGIGTNVLKMWEFDTRLRLGRFRPHHGFVFGSATSMIGWVVHQFAQTPIASAVTMALVLGAINFAYDVKALQSGILRVYNQPWSEGGSAFEIALDYAPWFFGGFGLVYGYGIVAGNFTMTLLASLALPAAGYIVQSLLRHGHSGLGARASRPQSPAVPACDDRRQECLRHTRSACSTDTPVCALESPSETLGDCGRDVRAPERLNWLILILAGIATSACLWAVCHGYWWLAIPFAFIDNAPFALMHEAVHGVASANSRRNYVFGFIASAMFPTSFSLQRVAHIGHHTRNRTDNDLYDYYLPTESRLIRNIWLYAGNLLGLYWFCIPLSNALYILATPLYRSKTFIEQIAPKMGFGPHVRDIAQLPPHRVWIEIVCAFAYQFALWRVLDLNWQGWLLAHGLFAMHWSALQYVDHAWSERDVIRGAWNLRVFAPVRWLTLNYHYHLAHHAHPGVPWTQLPQYVERDDAQPSFWQIYVSLWRHGVQPAPPMGAPAGRALFAPAD